MSLDDEEKEFLSKFAEEMGGKSRFDWPAWIVAVATCVPFAFLGIWWTATLSSRVERLEEQVKANRDENHKLRGKVSWILIHGKWTMDVPSDGD